MQPIVNFAYGSNLHPVRLTKRCPSARMVGLGALDGWRLAFHKRGRDGSAKCDAVHTGAPGDRLWVAAYELSPGDKPALDAAEGLGRGYGERTVRAAVGARVLTGRVYVAEAGAQDPALRPFDWYKAMVVRGAEYQGFPRADLARLRAVPCAPDPDPRRAEDGWRLVEEMEAANAALGRRA